MADKDKAVRVALGAQVEPWSRQEGESEVAFEAFATYRDLEPTERSLSEAARRLGKSKQVLSVWSRKWEWRARVRAWDDKQDEVQREAMLDERRKMGKRHANQSKSFQRLLMEPAVALGKKLSTDKEFAEKFRAGIADMKPAEALALIKACAGAYPSLMRAERLAMGESTDRVEGRISIHTVKAVASRIAARASKYIGPERLPDFLADLKADLANELGE